MKIRHGNIIVIKISILSFKAHRRANSFLINTNKNSVGIFCLLKITVSGIAEFCMRYLDQSPYRQLTVKLLIDCCWNSLSLTFPRLLVFAKAVFNSALRNVFSSNVSECKEVGGSDFTILLSEFELSKILVIVQIQIFTQ